MNYYPFHIGDFRAGTSNMSRQSRWLYRDMLDVYYDSEKPLPLDLDVLCDSIGVEAEEERRLVERLLRFKFIKTDGGYSHHICEVVIAEYRNKAEVAAKNGKAGGRPRKAKTDDAKPKNNPAKPSGLSLGSNPVTTGLVLGSDPVTTGLAKQTQGLADETQGKANETGLKANQEPRTNNQEKNNPVAPPTLSEDPARGATPVELSIELRKHGVNCQPADPRLHALSVQGVSIDTARAACEEARLSKPEPMVIALGYIVSILERWSKTASTINVAGATQPARQATAGYESTRDRERRETLEGLTGSGNEPAPAFIDII